MSPASTVSARAALKGSVSSLAAFWQNLSLREVSGSCGDLGTFIPLTVGLVKNNGLDLGTTLIFTGKRLVLGSALRNSTVLHSLGTAKGPLSLYAFSGVRHHRDCCYNVITGAAFGIPMPVQPMKTIAAVALSGSPLTVPQIVAAGMFVSGAVLLLGLTRMMSLVQSLIPMPVIRGLQLGLGLSLARKGFQQVWFANSRTGPARDWWGVEGQCLGIVALLFILLSVFTQIDGDPPSQQGAQHRQPLLPTSLPVTAEPVGLGACEHPREAYTDKLEAFPPSDIFTADSETTAVSLGGWAEAAAGAPAGTSVEDADMKLGSTATSSEVAGEGQSGAFAQNEDSRQLLLPATRQRRSQLKKQAERVGQQVANWSGWLEQQLLCSVGGRNPSSASEGAASSSGCSRRSQLPAALLLTVTGVVMTLVAHPGIIHALRFGPSRPELIMPSAADWRIGILRAGLPQLPLTTLNSVVSVCQLARDLYPERPASPNTVGASVGAMNLVGGWFGAMPCCHGAGGLAAQTRFGASTGAAPMFLGLVKLSLGLLFGSSLFRLLQSFPQPLMGAMLVYAGIELAAVARNQRGERGVAVMLLTAAVCLAMGNVAVGVIAGLVAAYSLVACDLLRERCIQS
ncbi:hypothetical protein N2152v2_006828 [Parachlorella kessleri]